MNSNRLSYDFDKTRQLIMKAVSLLFQALIMILCVLVSLYIGASAYESLFNKALPFVHTVDTVSLAPIAQNYKLTSLYKDTNSQKVVGIYGNLTSFEIPLANTRLDITAAPTPVSPDIWLSRANTVQFIPLTTARNNQVGIALLYMELSFRTIDQPQAIGPGDNLLIDTNKDWRYIYRIDKVQTISQNSNYVISDNGTNNTLVVDAYDKQTQSSLIIEATLLQVVGEQQ